MQISSDDGNWRLEEPGGNCARTGPRLRPHPRDEDEYRRWRSRVRAAVRRLAATGPGAADPLQAGAGGEQNDGTLVRQEFRFSRPGREFRAVLTRPRRAVYPRPAVVVCPGRNAEVDRVTGAQPPDYPDRPVAAQLAAVGFVTLTLDYGFAGSVDQDRRYGRDEAVLLEHLCAMAGRPLLGILARDAASALGWLRSQPLVQPDLVGLFGHSLGGAVALHAALAIESPVPLCTASHLGGYSVLGYGHPALALPGIARHADLPDLYAALAPAPLQLQYGLADRELDPADCAAAAATVSALYHVAGAAGRVEARGLSMGHGTGTAEALDFFGRALAAAAPATAQTTSRPAAMPLIPPVRIDFDTRMREHVADLVDEAFESGTLTLGATVARFEQELGPWVGGTAVAVDSGSAALEIALRCIGVAGRTVLVPVNTFVATAAAAVRAGAEVDFVDLEPVGLGLDAASLGDRLDQHGDRVAAVLAVHTGGFVAPSLHGVLETCRARGIPVVEDAAHAFGSSLAGRPAGSLADFGAYSFYPTKVLTCGEGGAVTGQDPGHVDAFRRLRDHGRSRPGASTHDVVGSNWRMSEFHAAVGLAQLRVFRERTAARARIAAAYDEQLADLAGLRVVPPPPGSATSWYKYVAELRDDLDRAALKARLRAEHGVLLSGEVYDLLLVDQPCFAAGRSAAEFPQAARFAGRHICLPIYSGLTEGEQDRIVAALRKELS